MTVNIDRAEEATLPGDGDVTGTVLTGRTVGKSA